MQFLLRRAWVLAMLPGLATIAGAQTAAKPAQKAPPWKSYCQKEEGFCFKYPAGWTMLGEVFDGNGVAVAPPQKQAQEFWDAVTVALVIPPPQGDEDPVTIDEAIAKAVAGVRESGQDFETLQRQQRTVDGKPAQLVKVHYADKTNGREWVEELVFVEGPDAEIYSVALKCAPVSLARIEPLFLRTVDSFRLPEAEAAPGATDEEAPAGQSKAPAKGKTPGNSPPKP
jgi:hypothetical protein